MRSYQFEVRGPLPCLNDMLDAAKGCGGRGYGYSSMKKIWTETAYYAVKAVRPPVLKRIELVFQWRENDKRRNPDNIAAAKKFILDGMVKAKVIPNDGWDEVAGWDDRFVTRKPGGVLVTVTEVA